LQFPFAITVALLLVQIIHGKLHPHLIEGYTLSVFSGLGTCHCVRVWHKGATRCSVDLPSSFQGAQTNSKLH
jgi:hypothetical protein